MDFFNERQLKAITKPFPLDVLNICNRAEQCRIAFTIDWSRKSGLYGIAFGISYSLLYFFRWISS